MASRIFASAKISIGSKKTDIKASEVKTMNAETNIELPQSVRMQLDTLKAVVAKQKIELNIEDLTSLKEMSDEIKGLQEASESVFEEIKQLETDIQEKRARIDELYNSLDPKLVYYMTPITQNPKPATRATNGDNPINKESVLKVLKENPYGLSNSGICEKLNVTNDKAGQNRAYTIAKQLESEKSVTKSAHLWKVI